MRHFTDFSFRNNAVDAVKAAGDTIGAIGNSYKSSLNESRLGTSVGAVAGLLKGSGIGESEEEKAKTTKLGRLGKIAGNTLAGGYIGMSADNLGQVSWGYGKRSFRKIRDARNEN